VRRSRETVLRLPERKPSKGDGVLVATLYIGLGIGVIWAIAARLSETVGTWYQPFEGSGLVGSLLIASSVLLGRQIRSRWRWRKTAQGIVRRDPRALVLFCRSFKTEGRSENSIFRILLQALNSPLAIFFPGSPWSVEERLLGVASSVGPYIAIGNPREPRPTYGARRVYCSDSEWQKVFDDLVGGARAVIVTAPFSGFVNWEIETIRRRDELAKLFLIFERSAEARDASYEQFRGLMEKLGHVGMPDRIGNARILHIDGEGTVQLTPERFSLTDRLARGMLRAFKKAGIPTGEDPTKSIFTRRLSFWQALLALVGILVSTVAVLWVWAQLGG
jgi:hypothetical protein